MRLKYTILCFCLTLSSVGSSQIIPSILDTSKKMPVAGYDFNSYLFEHIRNCSDSVVGKIIVKFIVNEDGHISDCKLVQGVGGCWDSEVLKAVGSFPAWKPGKINGKPVKVWFTLPVTINLQ